MSDEKTAPEPPRSAAPEEWDEAWLPEWIGNPEEPTADEPTVDEPTPEPEEPAEPAEPAVVVEPEQDVLEPEQDDEPADLAGEPADPGVQTPAAYVPPRVVVRPRVRPHRRARNTLLVGLFVAPAPVGAAPLAPSWGAPPPPPLH